MLKSEKNSGSETKKIRNLNRTNKSNTGKKILLKIRLLKKLNAFKLRKVKNEPQRLEFKNKRDKREKMMLCLHLRLQKRKSSFSGFFLKQNIVKLPLQTQDVRLYLLIISWCRHKQKKNYYFQKSRIMEILNINWSLNLQLCQELNI